MVQGLREGGAFGTTQYRIVLSINIGFRVMYPLLRFVVGITVLKWTRAILGRDLGAPVAAVPEGFW